MFLSLGSCSGLLPFLDQGVTQKQEHLLVFFIRTTTRCFHSVCPEKNVIQEVTKEQNQKTLSNTASHQLSNCRLALQSLSYKCETTITVLIFYLDLILHQYSSSSEMEQAQWDSFALPSNRNIQTLACVLCLCVHIMFSKEGVANPKTIINDCLIFPKFSLKIYNQLLKANKKLLLLILIQQVR